MDQNRGTSIKAAARDLLDSLPDDATWGELTYAFYVRDKVERGRVSAREGRSLTTDEVRTLLGIA